jgi:hypothetical protein
MVTPARASQHVEADSQLVAYDRPSISFPTVNTVSDLSNSQPAREPLRSKESTSAKNTQQTRQCRESRDSGEIAAARNARRRSEERDLALIYTSVAASGTCLGLADVAPAVQRTRITVPSRRRAEHQVTNYELKYRTSIL